MGYPGSQFAASKGESYEGIFEMLTRQQFIKAKAFSVWLDNENEGRLLLGGYDRAKFLGQLSPFPIITTTKRGIYKIDGGAFWRRIIAGR